jgi:MarR-like DNA-binding transcriptional regulator SgrR of sgrS sRNA
MRPRARDAIMERSRANGAPRYLLSTLIEYADDRGIAWPSIETLAHKLRRTERNIYHLLHRLVALGEVTIESGGGRHRNNHYHLSQGLLNPERAFRV